jgi:hypothetical protein
VKRQQTKSFGIGSQTTPFQEQKIASDTDNGILTVHTIISVLDQVHASQEVCPPIGMHSFLPDVTQFEDDGSWTFGTMHYVLLGHKNKSFPNKLPQAIRD